jgi:hypothetical protein
MDTSPSPKKTDEIPAFEKGEEVADVFAPIFNKTHDVILEMGLRQMREENESLWCENRRLKDKLRVLNEQLRKLEPAVADERHP